MLHPLIDSSGSSAVAIKCSKSNDSQAPVTEPETDMKRVREIILEPRASRNQKATVSPANRVRHMATEYILA
jgi:hypothetical protein